jgi:hypothetical protein
MLANSAAWREPVTFRAIRCGSFWLWKTQYFGTRTFALFIAHLIKAKV